MRGGRPSSVDLVGADHPVHPRAGQLVPCDQRVEGVLQLAARRGGAHPGIAGTGAKQPAQRWKPRRVTESNGLRFRSKATPN